MTTKQSTALIKRRSDLPANVLADRVIARLRDAEQALQQATGIHQVKLVADVASAQQVFASRQRLGDDIIGYAHSIKIYALARLGDLLEQMPKATGGKRLKGLTGAKGRISSTAAAHLIDAPTYADLGLDRKTASIAQQLAALPSVTREAIAQRETTIAKVRRETRAAEVRQSVSLPDAKYRVLYADPPWSYSDKADAGSVQHGGTGIHYPSMTIAELSALSIPLICEENAVLFLWVTSPLLFESAAVIKAWGFNYKASFVWDKVKHNMGHYNSVRHEFLLICTRGSCTPDVVELFDSVQSIERTEHSTKPEEFRAIIDTIYPYGKRLELFARRDAPGWDTYGNECPLVVACS